MDGLPAAAERPGMDGNAVPNAHFGQIAGVLLNGKAAVPAVRMVVRTKVKKVEEIKRGNIKDMGVPHYIHMPHNILVVDRDGFVVGDWQV